MSTQLVSRISVSRVRRLGDGDLPTLLAFSAGGPRRARPRISGGIREVSSLEVSTVMEKRNGSPKTDETVSFMRESILGIRNLFNSLIHAMAYFVCRSMGAS